MHSTIAFSGGFRYRPTTSISFSSNFGSLDSLNVSTRCGLSPRAAHTRCTVAADTPAFAAIVRHDQWVWPSGVECLVRCTISSIFSCGIVDLRPRPARTFPSFAKPSSANRARHARTVAGFTPTCAAILDVGHTIGRQQQRLGPLNLPMRARSATATKLATLLVDRPT